MKYIIGICVLLGLAIAAFFGLGKYHSLNQTIGELNNELNQHKEIATQNQTLEKNIKNLKESLAEKERSSKTYTIFALGDIMLDRGVKARVNNNGGDFSFSFEKIMPYLEQADLVFANLEGSVSSVGSDSGKKYSFRFQPKVTEALSAAGIDVISLANNHMLDWGRDSLCQTTQHLAAANINFIGAGCNSDQAEKPYITTLGNTKIGFLAYTEFYQGAHATETRPGLSKYNLEKIAQNIANLKDDEDIDLVMVSMHWGVEYKHRATDHQVEIGHRLIDAGADVVIGHHPHVDQEIERYGDGWIIYSLGNFIFDQSWSEETMQGLVAEIEISDKHIVDIVPQIIQLNNNFQPYLP